MACFLWRVAAAGITGLSRAVITLVVELLWLALAQQGAPCREHMQSVRFSRCSSESGETRAVR